MKTKKTVRYKGWLIRWDDDSCFWLLYTPDEIEQPVEFRYAEAEIETLELSKAFIDNYDNL